MRRGSGTPRACRKAVPRSRGLLPIAGPGAETGAYVGRFAPSPTGPLHLGSLLAAAASFIHARQHHGEWLLRIENIDPPREQSGAADSILRTLEAFDLHWDREVSWQLDRLGEFRAAADRLLAEGLAYRCECSRRQILETSGSSRYPGTCRDLALTAADTTIRVRAPRETIRFVDGRQGPVSHDIARTEGDFVIFRRDGLPAYHLAVVVDDARAGVTDIVRGADLLEQTALHLHLQRLLGLTSPRYWHVPVVTNPAGEKLSKQTGATPVDDRDAAQIALEVLRLLGLEPPKELAGAPPRELWSWATPRWSVNASDDGRTPAGRPPA